MIRITPQDIDKTIRSSKFDIHGRRLTVCVVTMQNGYLVTGTSSCNDPAEFDGAKGRAYALTEAREKVGALLAYAARELTPRPVAETVLDLSAAMRADAGLAWSWHCNIAMAFQDAATDTFMAHDQARLSYVANEAAARFMKQAFGVEGYGPGAMRGPRQVERDTPEKNNPTPYAVGKRAAAADVNRAMTEMCERVAGVDWANVNPPPAVTACILKNGCHKAPACSGGCEALPKTRNG